MRSLWVKPASSLKGEIALYGDKSIAHRCIIVSSITPGKTILENFPLNEDCLSTINVFKKLGIKIKKVGSRRETNSATVIVSGKGLRGLKRPKGPIFVGDSGTTLRLVLGVLAGCNFKTRIIAGRSLSQRPMLRVTRPLRMMGAHIRAKSKELRAKSKKEEYLPITIRGGVLKPITYKVPVVSAQVKSAILLAALYAKGKTSVFEPIKTRDHSERILKLFKAELKVKGNKIVIKGNRELTSPKRVYIPGDISSASFFMVMAAILPNSCVLIKNVSLNPSRSGIINVLKRMEADIKISAKGGFAFGEKNYEPMGDIIVKSSRLKGTMVKKEEIPSLIDELPILMVVACFAKGKSTFAGVEELRIKETDRIKALSENLIKMGADIRVNKKDGSESVIIRGVKELVGTKVRSFADHRTAMSMIVAGLKAKGETLIDDITCINKSFPDFTRQLKTLMST